MRERVFRAGGLLAHGRLLPIACRAYAKQVRSRHPVMIALIGAVLRSVSHRTDGGGFGAAANRRLRPHLVRSTFDSCRADTIESHSSVGPHAEVAAPSMHPRRSLYAAVETSRRSFTRAGVQWEERMNRRTTSMLAGAMIAASSALAADVTPERLINADHEPQNWLMNH